MRSWTRSCNPSWTTFTAGRPRHAIRSRRTCRGLLFGLYHCRHGNSETLLEYCPDYAAERASGVVSDCPRLGIELPTDELLDLMPEWNAMLH